MSVKLNICAFTHIDHISIKVSKVIGIMFRLKFILPSDVLQQFNNATFSLLPTNMGINNKKWA